MLCCFDDLFKHYVVRLKEINKIREKEFFFTQNSIEYKRIWQKNLSQPRGHNKFFVGMFDFHRIENK